MPALIRMVRHALELPPGEAARRAMDLAALRMAHVRERIEDVLAPSAVDSAATGRRLGAGQVAPEAHFANLFRSRLAVLPLAWPERLGAEALPRPDARAAILRSAGEAIAHRFDLLGSGPVRVDYELEARGVEGRRYRMAAGAAAAQGRRQRMEALLPGSAGGYDPIDWHIDFKSGYRWRPDRASTAIRFGDVPGVDVKVPWELSRFQHLVPLGLAYRVAPDSPEGRRAPAEFVAQVVDWIAANPPRRGVNWICTMDVAIRAANWLAALALFDGAPAVTPELRWLLARSLHAHGRHIEAHLEYDRHYSGNHYLSNVAGLVCLGAALPEAPEADRWLLFGLQELADEMRRQVLPDGACFEGSTAYHLLVMEMFCVASAVALRLPEERRRRLVRAAPGRLRHPLAPPIRSWPKQELGLGRAEIFPGPYFDRLERMARFAQDMRKPNGACPRIGDDDSGRFLGACSELALPLAARLFGRPEWVPPAHPAALEPVLVVPEPAPEVRTAVAAARVQNDGAASRRDASAAGVVVYRDPGIAVVRAGSLWLAASFGRVAPGYTGSHVHNDLLSFELQWDGADFVVDGGSYLYTPDPQLRNAFRSTEAHSTIASAIEQREWAPESLFRVTRDAEVAVLAVESQRFAVACRYGDVARRVQHARTWRWDADVVEIEDRVSGPAPLRWILNLAPGVEFVQQQQTGPDRHELALRRDGRELRLTLEGTGAPRLAAGFFSAGYGRRIDNQRLIAEVTAPAVHARLAFTRLTPDTRHPAPDT